MSTSDALSAIAAALGPAELDPEAEPACYDPRARAEPEPEPEPEAGI